MSEWKDVARDTNRGHTVAAVCCSFEQSKVCVVVIHDVMVHHSCYITTITSLITSRITLIKHSLITHHSSLITHHITSHHSSYHSSHHSSHAQSKAHTHLPQDCGFKVVTHMMPDLPNMGYERDILGFKCSPLSPLTSENSSRTPPSAQTVSNCTPPW